MEMEGAEQTDSEAGPATTDMNAGIDGEVESGIKPLKLNETNVEQLSGAKGVKQLPKGLNLNIDIPNNAGEQSVTASTANRHGGTHTPGNFSQLTRTRGETRGEREKVMEAENNRLTEELVVQQMATGEEKELLMS